MVIIVAILSIIGVGLAAAASLRIMNREYLPLLEEMERTKQVMEEAESQKPAEEGE